MPFLPPNQQCQSTEGSQKQNWNDNNHNRKVSEINLARVDSGRQSYTQERGCLVHCLRRLAVWWPGARSARINHVLACNFAKHSPILIFFHWRLKNKPFLFWLLTTPPHLKYVATLPCNLSLIACFLTVMFHKVVWQHMKGMVDLLITTLLRIYLGMF